MPVEMLFRSAIFCVAVVSFTAGSAYGPQTTCPICAPNDCGLVPIEFAFTCPNGNILDKCGCVRSCLCAGCPSFDANLPCPFGKKTDSKGCPLSECNPPPPPPCEFAGDCAAVTCFADFGNAVDENGCPLRGCPCQGAANCPAVVGCNLDCSNRGGYKTGADGCVTCECVLPDCEFAGDCALVFCGNIAKDENNCPLRDCPCDDSANCPAVVGCDIDCSNRGGYQKDSNGCVKCQCVNHPGSCPQYGVWGSKSCNSDSDCQYPRKCCSVGHKYSNQKVCHGSSRGPSSRYWQS